MRIKHLREEKGSGLVLTLMVLLVLSVLGVAIGTLTLGSYRLSVANRDDTSAYYVAEAGAVAAYEEIQSKVLSAYETNATEDSFDAKVSAIVSEHNDRSADGSVYHFDSGATATTKINPETYTITSIGEVGGKKRTVTKQVTVNWVSKNTVGSGLPTLPTDAVLLTEGAIYIGGSSTITGDSIYTNAPKTGINIFGSTKYKGNEVKSIDFEPYAAIKAPDINNLNTEINLTISKKSAKLVLDSDVYISEIQNKSNETYTINTTGQDRMIVVGTLNSGGNIVVTGGGTLTIVTDTITNINNISFNGGGSANITLVYLGDTALDFAGNAVYNMMLIAPNAAVSLTGTCSINGMVIAKTFKMFGNASLNYAAVKSTGYPFGSTASAADPEPEAIISSEPIIEK